MTRAFFEATAGFQSRHTAALDFLHAASAALWNTRWQVNGYVTAVPDAHPTDLEARFVRGSGVRVNVKRSFLDMSWEDHQRELAALALVNSIALFEGWAESMADRTGVAFAKKNLQFPTRVAPDGKTQGAGEAIRRIKASGPSPAMSGAFARVLERDPHYRLAELESLLTVYRYFKEVRNDLVHGGGTASDRVVEAHREAQAASAASLRMREAPVMPTPVPGSPTALSLRGVIGLTAVVYSIVRTIDAEVVGTVAAENEFLKRFSARHNPARLPHRSPSREQKLRALVFQLDMPKPDQIDGLVSLLQSRSLIGIV